MFRICLCLVFGQVWICLCLVFVYVQDLFMFGICLRLGFVYVQDLFMFRICLRLGFVYFQDLFMFRICLCLGFVYVQVLFTVRILFMVCAVLALLPPTDIKSRHVPPPTIAFGHHCLPCCLGAHVPPCMPVHRDTSVSFLSAECGRSDMWSPGQGHQAKELSGGGMLYCGFCLGFGVGL